MLERYIIKSKRWWVRESKYFQRTTEYIQINNSPYVKYSPIENYIPLIAYNSRDFLFKKMKFGGLENSSKIRDAFLTLENYLVDFNINNTTYVVGKGIITDKSLKPLVTVMAKTGDDDWDYDFYKLKILVNSDYYKPECKNFWKPLVNFMKGLLETVASENIPIEIIPDIKIFKTPDVKQSDYKKKLPENILDDYCLSL